jgi:hypothetical protein
MHVGLWTGRLYPQSDARSLEPCSFTKVPDCPQTVNILCIQEMELKYACLSEAKASHTKYGLRFLPLLHTSYIRDYWSTPLSKDVLSRCYVQ